MATLGELLTGLANKKQGLYDLLTGQTTGGANAVELPPVEGLYPDDLESPNSPKTLKTNTKLLKKKQDIGIEPIVMSENGDIDQQASLALENHVKPLTIKERLLGRTLSKDIEDTSKFNPETGEGELTTGRTSNTRPGLLQDIASGYNENRSTPISLENFGQNTLADGRNKGFAYRLGEGLGSLARIGESPLGRGLITAGLVGATGGSGLEALAYGGQAGVLNQQNRSADQMYRNQLKDNYGYSEDDLNKVHGYINKDTFNNLTKSQNSAMNIAIKQQTTDSMNRLRELQTENLRIKNSYLPEKEKAELLKKNAEARYAEEYQLARIKALENSYINPLGWATYGLKADEFKEKQKQNQAKIDEQQAETELLKSLGGTSRANSNPLGI
jgi:hypothetical protein